MPIGIFQRDCAFNISPEDRNANASKAPWKTHWEFWKAIEILYTILKSSVYSYSAHWCDFSIYLVSPWIHLRYFDAYDLRSPSWTYCNSISNVTNTNPIEVIFATQIWTWHLWFPYSRFNNCDRQYLYFLSMISIRFRMLRKVFVNAVCISMVSCQKGPTRHAYAWQIGPFWQDTLDMCSAKLLLTIQCVFMFVPCCPPKHERCCVNLFGKTLWMLSLDKMSSTHLLTSYFFYVLVIPV